MDDLPMNRTDVRRRRARGERGQVLAMVSVLLIALLGFSAFAIDLGIVYNARRQDQNAADAGSLGAAISLGDDAETVAQAIALVNSTLTSPLATAAFNTCANEVIESGYIKSSASNCISWNTARTRVRVRVPLQSVPSGVASVLGITEFDHTAYAIAGVSPLGFGNVLPFALLNGAGDYECLKAGASNVPDALCEGAYSGNFRMLDFAYFGDSELGTVTGCGNGGQQNRMANNAAVGVDHQLSIYGASPHGSTMVVDTDSPCAGTPRPNAVEVITGNIPQEAGSGLFSGTGFSDTGPGRLAREALYGWTDEADIGSFDLNDDPLWAFMPTSTLGLDIPASCTQTQFAGDTGGMNYPDNDNHMSALPDAVEDHLIDLPRNERIVKLIERCIAHWRGENWDDHGSLYPAESRSGCVSTQPLPCTSPVFIRNSDATENPDLWDIQLTPRFGYVPELVEAGAVLNGSSQDVRFSSFRPIYLQRLYGGNCNPNACDIEFDPGVLYSTMSNGTKANAITAFVIPGGMLPGNLGDVDAAYQIGVNRFVSLVR